MAASDDDLIAAAADELSRRRLAACAHEGLPPELGRWLVGRTEEELAEDAKTLRRDLSASLWPRRMPL